MDLKWTVENFIRSLDLRSQFTSSTAAKGGDLEMIARTMMEEDIPPPPSSSSAHFSKRAYRRPSQTLLLVINDLAEAVASH